MFALRDLDAHAGVVASRAQGGEHARLVHLRAERGQAEPLEEAVMSNHPEIVDVVVHLEPAERRR